MGKAKTQGQPGPGQKHLHSRLSFLYQAATYLASVEPVPRQPVQAALEKEEARIDHTHPKVLQMDMDRSKLDRDRDRGSTKGDEQDEKKRRLISLQGFPMSRLAISHLKAVSLKGQVRLSPKMKHSICRRCDVLLRPGLTSTSTLENTSRGGKKPWADVLVVTCLSCSAVKRFPVGARRQHRRADRGSKNDVPAS